MTELDCVPRVIEDGSDELDVASYPTDQGAPQKSARLMEGQF